MTILVTGGAGYIGSHACVELLAAGFQVVILDDFSNSSPRVVERIEQVAGRAPALVTGDIADRELLDSVLADHDVGAVIHFAGSKILGESIEKPLAYYLNNVAGTLNLLAAMAAAQVKTLVFSSTAAVYGVPASVPVREDAPLAASTPYGRSKLMVEDMLRDLALADPDWQIAILRYFNPVGAHPSGLIGEDPRGTPGNLVPAIGEVAAGRRKELLVLGTDYPTRDGTGVRDYIHVVDLARGHLAALDALQGRRGTLTVNLGTGRGYSVIETLRAYEAACGRAIPYRAAPRRAGDVAACYADATLAADLIGWRAERGLDEMCADAWRWLRGNPEGYDAVMTQTTDQGNR